MTTRINGPLAGFGWLSNGFSVGFRHPKPLLGGAALLTVVCLLPTLVTLPMQMHSITARTPQSPMMVGWIMAISFLFSLLMVPLYAGYLRMVDATERGMPASALGIFDFYRKGGAWRLIGYGLANLGLYVVLIAIVIALSGNGIVSWYLQLISAQAAHQQPPALPQGFGTAMALFTVLCLFMMGFYSISLGQITLRQRSVFGAIGDGIVGALKNLLPLLVFALSFLLVGVVAIIAIALVAFLLALLGKLVGVWLVLVLMIPFYIAVMLLMFTMTFGAMYHLWRDVCGDGITPDMAPATAI